MRISTFLFLLFFLSQNLLAQQKQISCGVNESILPESTIKAMQMAPTWLKQQQARKSADEFYVSRIAVDIDSDTYLLFKKDTTLIKIEVIKAIERVSKIYEAEINTQLVVSFINIRKDTLTDPYRGVNDVFTLLFTLMGEQNNGVLKNVAFDHAVYLPTKTLYGAGGLAAGQFNVSSWNNVEILAHELGHNFGSPHTQSCNWPGGVIDYCYPAEGDCYTGALDIKMGTIMSYCERQELTFHPLCRALMQNYAATYLKKINVMSSITLSGSKSIDGSYYIFNPIPSAEKYYYQVSETNDFSKVITSDSSDVNIIHYGKVSRNKTYYLRLKAKNRLGSSEWSNTVAIEIPSNILTVPKLLTPLDNIKEVNPTKEMLITFEPIEGATSYELEAMSSLNLSMSRFITNTSNYFLIIPDSLSNYPNFYWRVRAINGNIKGHWSETRRVIMAANSKDVQPMYDQTNNLQLSIPFTYNVYDRSYEYKLTVSKNKDFSFPITKKTIVPSSYNISSDGFLLENLVADTEYYLKLETINPKKDLIYGFPEGVLKTFTTTFNTGNFQPSKTWKYLTEDNIPNIGVNSSNNIVTNNSIFKYTEKGIVKINTDNILDNIKPILYNLETTNKEIGNVIKAIDVDSLGNIWAIMAISKRDKYIGVYPVLVYALKQFDSKTMKLLSSRQLNFEESMPYFFSLNINYGLIIAGAEIFKIDNNLVKPFYKFNVEEGSSLASIVVSKTNIWFLTYTDRVDVHTSTYTYTLSRYNFITKEVIHYNHTNNSRIPSLISRIKLDKQQNLWLINNNEIVKYDGQTWTNYRSETFTNNYIDDICFDDENNLYVNTNFSQGKIFTLKNDVWKQIAEFPTFYSYSLEIDKQGKFWLNNYFGNLVVSPCGIIAKPDFINNVKTIDAGQSINLEAKGCSNVMWNWSSAVEQVNNKLISGTNILAVNPKATTAYSARCYDNGCMSDETVFSLAVRPNLLTNKVVKNEVCLGDSIKVLSTIEGFFDENNVLSATLTSSSKTKYSFTLVNQNSFSSFVPSSNIQSGKYWLKIGSSSPKLTSKDSVEITIAALPTGSISGTNNFCAGGSTMLVATTNNTASYQWFEGENMISTNNNTILATKRGKYTILLKNNIGCTSTTEIFTVTENPLPTGKITGTTNFCEGSSTVLSINSNNAKNYQWLEGKNIVGTNNSITVTKPGQYAIVLKSDSGCVSTADTVIVIQNIVPIAKISGDKSFCEGSTKTLTTSVSAGLAPFTYTWKLGSTLLTDKTNTVNITKEGNYSTVVTDANGCADTTDIHAITEIKLVKATITKSGTTDILQNTDVTLSVIQDASYTYQWNKDNATITGATTNTFTAKEAGIYNVTITANGCSSTTEPVTVNLVTANEPNTYWNNVYLNAFPNPNEGHFTLEFTNNDNQPISLYLYDILGKTMIQKVIKTKGKYSEVIDISTYPSGEYFLMLQKNDFKKTLKLRKK